MMKLIRVNTNNAIYYSKDFVKGFECGTKRQLESDERSIPRGHWIDKGEYAECSNCGADSGTQFDGVEPVPRKTKFCSNCGADMRGDAE